MKRSLQNPPVRRGGYTTYKCPLCEDEYVADETAPTGICALAAVPEEEASCTAPGMAAHYRCADCGKAYWDAEGAQPVAEPAQLEIPKAGCTPEAVAEEAASCTAPGMAAHYRCAVCGGLYLDEAGTQPVADPAQLEIPQKEHAFGPWQTVTAPTPEQPGTEQRQCQNCDTAQTRETDVLKSGLSTPSLQIKADSSSGKPCLSWKKVSKATAYRIYLVDPQTGERTLLEETAARSYTYQDALPGNTYTFTVAAVNGTHCSKYSSQKSVLCKCPKPVLTMTSEPQSGKPIAQWEAVEGAVSYILYRSASSNKNFKPVAETTELSVQVDSSAAGKTYYYRLRAVGPAEGSNSSYSATVRQICACARPVIRVTSGDPQGVKISWERVSGARKYEVYRASQENGEYTRIATTGSASYTDTKAPKNQLAFYQVRAYGSGTGSRGAFSETAALMNHTFGQWQTVIPGSAEAEGRRERQCSACGHTEEKVTPVLKQSLSTPKLRVSAAADTGKPTLSWDSVKGASRYQIWLVDTATGERTFLEEISGKKYTHEDTQVGVTYTYQLVAVSDSKCSKLSTAKQVVHKCPRPVLTVTSEPVSGKPVVKWAAVEGAVSYVLYRSASSNKNFKPVAETAELSVLVDSAAANKTYYYRLQAIGAAEGTSSAYSATLKHVCDCAQPVVITASGTNGGIKVSWEKVEGAKYYYVYRASSQTGSYTQLTKTTSRSYTDTKAPKNQLSYYMVKACGSNSASQSAFSQIVSAWNHTFGSWTTVLPSTPDSEGIQERTCTYCGHTETKTIPVLKRTLKTPVLTVSSETASGKPALSWKSVSNAKEYLVYLREGDTYTFIAATAARSYVHQDALPGREYSYAIAAVNTTSCSAYSQSVSAVCRCPMPQPEISADPDTGAQRLAWSPVEGADSYRVYRSAAKNTQLTLLGVVDGCSWAISGETPGVQYYYNVQAVCGSRQDADSLLSEACYDSAAGDTFVIHAGQISDTCNKIVWKNVADATQYEVYRANGEDGPFTKIATVKEWEYLDMKVEAGRICYYQVKAVGENTQVLSPVQAADAPSQVPVRIYISPSCQTANKYAYGNTTEAIQCRAIAVLTVQALERCGFAAITNVTDDMDERMAESNAWNADLHVPIHSNAFNKSAMGTQVYHDGVSGSISRKACSAIYKVLAPLSPGSSGERTRANPGLYEIRNSQAPTAYIEVAFHDTVTEAKWIINNKPKIAEAICKGICNLYGVPYIAP